jgi:hypothetical protein
MTRQQPAAKAEDLGQTVGRPDPALTGAAVIHCFPASENGILRSAMEDRVNKTNRELREKYQTLHLWLTAP